MTLKWNWEQVESAIDSLFKQSNFEDVEWVIAIENGGVIPAELITQRLQLPCFETIHLYIHDNKQIFDRIIGKDHILFVDDINDSGETIEELQDKLGLMFGTMNRPIYSVATLVKRKSSKSQWAAAGVEVDHKEWIEFPWEYNKKEVRDRDVSGN